MHPQKADIPLQGLDRCVLIVRAISGPHCQIGALNWYHFTMQSWIYMVRKLYFEEADLLTLANAVEAVKMHSLL